MTFSLFINSVDVSDHVLQSSPVPHIKRDRVLQPLTGNFNLVVSQLITPVIGQGVLVKIDGDIRFSGFITTLNKNFSNQTYELGVISSLAALKDLKVDYPTLHTTIASSATDNEYKAVDNEGFPNVAIIWLLKKMFITAGLTLDTSNVEDLLVESGGIYGTVQEKNLVLDENTLYALEQEVALNTLVIESNVTSGQDTFEDKKITCLEFFQRYCIGRQWYVQPTTTAHDFELFARVAFSSGNNYSVSDDNKYGYKTTTANPGTGTDNVYELKYSSDAIGATKTTTRSLYAQTDFVPADVNTSTEQITSTAHGLKDDSVIRFTTTGTLPSPLSASIVYYAVGIVVDSFQVSLTRGGTAVNITSIGSGTHSYYGEYELKIFERQGFGKFRVPFWNNLHIRYHTSGTSSGSVQANTKLSTSLMQGGYANYYHINPMATETILTDGLDFSKPRMTEHWLNIKDKTHKITQALA